MNYLETAPSQLQEPVTLHRGFLPIFGGDVVEKKSETAIVGNVRGLDAVRLHFVLWGHLVPTALIDAIGEPTGLLDEFFQRWPLEPPGKNGFAHFAVVVGAHVEVAVLLGITMAGEPPVDALHGDSHFFQLQNDSASRAVAVNADGERREFEVFMALYSFVHALFPRPGYSTMRSGVTQ